MYYRYKSKKKDRKLFKFFIFIILSVFLGYIAYQYRHVWMFWRVTQNKIVLEIEKAAQMNDPERRINQFKLLSSDIEIYKKDNPLEADAYIYSSMIYYNYGLALCRSNFSTMYLYDTMGNISTEAHECFIRSVKDASKGIALRDRKGIDPNAEFLLCKAYFFSKFNSNQFIYDMLENKVKDIKQIAHEDARFFAYICILVGKDEEGLLFLQKYGSIEDSIQGRLFMARALCDAKRYTEAIVAYQKIIKSCEDKNFQWLAYMYLGRIYYNQHLFSESLDQFVAASMLDNKTDCKIWIGKSYLALNMKDKAKTIWNEALAADPINEEVKKLLSSI